MSELRIQRCGACGHHQHYARPFCLACQSDDVALVAAAGTGTLHAMTEVHVKVAEHLDPPHRVGLVDLAEGPRVMTLVADGAGIGDPVTIGFRDGLPEARRA